MIKNLLADARKAPVFKEEMLKVFKITLVVFSITFGIHLFMGFENFATKNLFNLLLIHFIMSFFITIVPSLTGAYWINNIANRKISLTLRSIIYFVLIVLAISLGIYIGQSILILIGLFENYFGRIALGSIFVFSCLIGAIVIIYYGAKEKLEEAQEKIRIQERQKSELKILKTKAEFEALQAKINPHFLFNSLNSIVGLISIEAKKAEEMTLKLADLFRSTLKHKDCLYVSLKEETSLIKSYLDIEKIRFGKRLRYIFDINPDLNYLEIPRLLIQPIVENALKHGIENLPDGGEITLSVQKKGERCEIKVSNTGKEIDGKISFGYGLTNIEKRLKSIYEEDFTFEILSKNGTEVKIQIPLNRADI